MESGRAVPPAGVVALDGPSGTGKSTVARALAQRLSWRYLDTGAMYRAATVAAIEAGLLSDRDAGELSPEAALRIAAAVAAARIDITTQATPARVWLDGREITDEIRSPRTTTLVSVVSAIPAIRTHLVAAQRELIGAGAIVVEGRDIGTVVWPEAALKVFLTADPVERARRRASELGRPADVAAVEADLGRRDRFDSSRTVSPLQPAADAVELDTSDLSIDEVVNRLVDMTIDSSVTNAR
jgi:CMP/dCMP kinase